MGAESHPANDDKLQSQGRKDNAAQPLNASPDNAGAARYPAVNKDDSVDSTGEGRGFGANADAPANPQPRQGAGDSSLHQAGLSGDADADPADDGRR
jgi:hypothetical protein